MNRVPRSFTRAFLCTGMLMLLAAAVPVFGQSTLCTQDAYNSYNGLTAHPKTLSCTANDVQLSAVTGVSIINSDGTITSGGKCVSGTPFSFIADFTIKTTSSSARSNIGIYFGTGAGNITNDQALTGTCSDSILTPTYGKTTTGANPTNYTLGDPNYEELDTNGETSPNGCGDTSSTDNNPPLPVGEQTAELEVDNVSCPLTASPCPNDPSTTCMALPECTTWYQPTANIPLCSSTDHNWVPAAVAGTTSKCNCTTLYIPIQLIQPSATVAKSCNTTLTTGTGKTDCDAGPEGSPVTYHVTISNTTPANEGGLVVDQICDNRYGSIYDDGVVTTACPTGTIGHSYVTGTTCGSGTVGDIANGSSGSCDFTVGHGENLSVTDTVSIMGHSDIATTTTFSGSSNTVTAHSSDAPSSASTTKGLATGPINACVTLRYNVTVANTGAEDETLTLNQVGTYGQAGYATALNDSYFGDITQDHGTGGAGSVTGTTCGVAGSAGQGTLSGSPGAGAFPKTLAAGTGTPPTSDGGSYTCQFDGVICGAPSSTAVADCAEGLTNLDTVTANLTADEAADTITQNSHQFTANVCLVQSGSSAP
jgi:hypothetical protein